MDRLARNVEDMLRLVREMNDRGVSVQFVKENMSFTAGSNDPRSILMFTMLSAFAQFERSPDKGAAAGRDSLGESQGSLQGQEAGSQRRQDCAAAGAGRSGSKPEQTSQGIWDKPRNPLSIHPIGRKIALVWGEV